MEVPYLSEALTTFEEQFQCRPDLGGQVRVTREAFMTAYYECLSPLGTDAAAKANVPTHMRLREHGYEAELISGPHHLENLRIQLERAEYPVRGIRSLLHVAKLPIEYHCKEYGGTGIAHTRIEVFLRDRHELLRAYNSSMRYYEQLKKRKEAAPLFEHHLRQSAECVPSYLESWEKFRLQAVERGFNQNVEANRSLIRMTAAGSIEFRMFEATTSLDTIMGFAHLCHALCTFRE